MDHYISLPRENNDISIKIAFSSQNNKAFIPWGKSQQHFNTGALV